jgi:alkylation response protein AidB-like acyl-CoA dehydrogenase
MNYELQPRTESGRHLVRIAETHAVDFERTAVQNDSEAYCSPQNVEALRDSGYLYAPFPVEHGGLGVESVHDLLVASSRLARAEPAVTIGANMHVIGAALVARSWRVARVAGDIVRTQETAAQMEGMVRAGMIIAAIISEPNQDLTRPATRASQAEGGWQIFGRKVFGTMAPVATHLAVGLSFENDRGEERYGFALVPPTAPGVILHDDWDALGMRASGSGSITFDGVMVPANAVRDAGFASGSLSPLFLERYLSSGAFHAAASVGIAEAANRLSLEAVAGRLASKRKSGDGPSPSVQMLIAENAVEMGAIRAMLARAGDVVDGYNATHPGGSGTLDEAAAAFADVQAAKVFITDAAQRVVDRSLSMAGGAGFMNRNPLSRHYRDVRAGAFMHPLSSTAARDFIARTSLGIEARI